jgi:anti-anti-sigma regulatory factor
MFNMSQAALRRFWQRLTAPTSLDKTLARQEYMTKVILGMTTLMLLMVTPIACLAFMFGLLQRDFPIISGIITLFVLGSWGIAYRGGWRISCYILIIVLFLNAFYNNYVDGIGTTGMAYYILVILTTAMLVNIKAMWRVVALCLASYWGLGWLHVHGYLTARFQSETAFMNWGMDVTVAFTGSGILIWFLISQFQRAAAQARTSVAALTAYKVSLEDEVTQRTIALQRETAERERWQQQVIDNQQQIIHELSTPVIPVIEGVIVLPLIGVLDSARARDFTRALLAGITQYRAKIVILDITGVPLIDSMIANHLARTVQAASLKGARVIITGVSDAAVETIVELGIDWSHLETLADLQTGLAVALKERGSK